MLPDGMMLDAVVVGLSGAAHDPAPVAALEGRGSSGLILRAVCGGGFLCVSRAALGGAA